MLCTPAAAFAVQHRDKRYDLVLETAARKRGWYVSRPAKFQTDRSSVLVLCLMPDYTPVDVPDEPPTYPDGSPMVLNPDGTAMALNPDGTPMFPDDQPAATAPSAAGATAGTAPAAAAGSAARAAPAVHAQSIARLKEEDKAANVCEHDGVIGVAATFSCEPIGRWLRLWLEELVLRPRLRFAGAGT